MMILEKLLNQYFFYTMLCCSAWTLGIVEIIILFQERWKRKRRVMRRFRTRMETFQPRAYRP